MELTQFSVGLRLCFLSSLLFKVLMKTVGTEANRGNKDEDKQREVGRGVELDSLRQRSSRYTCGAVIFSSLARASSAFQLPSSIGMPSTRRLANVRRSGSPGNVTSEAPSMSGTERV